MNALLNVLKPIVRLASKLDWLALLVARLGVGWIFTPGGWDKLHGLQGFADWFGTLGIPFPYVNAVVTALFEFIGGLCVIVGFGTRFFAVALSVIMMIALITVGPKSPSFNLTAQALESLQAAGVPDDIWEKLQSLKDQEITKEEEFLGRLQETIGEEQTVQYKSLLLKHAYQSNTQSLSNWLFKAESILIMVFILFMAVREYEAGRLPLSKLRRCAQQRARCVPCDPPSGQAKVPSVREILAGEG